MESEGIRGLIGSTEAEDGIHKVLKVFSPFILVNCLDVFGVLQ